MRRTFAAFLSGSLVLSAWACTDNVSHLFVANGFDPARSCTLPSTAVDVVDGEDPGVGCAPVCLADPTDDGGVSISTSTMCAPYPHGISTDGTHPLCAAALAARARGDNCLADGGTSNPLLIEDSGTDSGIGDAGTDSSSDAQ